MGFINFRVFRRNNKNLIILWSEGTLTAEQKGNVKSYISRSGSDEKELTFKSFSPDNPEKFTPDVGGMVISHSANNLDPSEACTVRVTFGKAEDMVEMEKDVMPANLPIQTNYSARKVHLYAWNETKNEWIPFPIEGILPGPPMLMLEKP